MFKAIQKKLIMKEHKNSNRILNQCLKDKKEAKGYKI